MAARHGGAAGLRSGDVLDRPAGVADPRLSPRPGADAHDEPAAERSLEIETSRTELVLGSLSLVATYLLIAWGVIGLRGFVAPAMAGLYAGTFLGLISLVAELAVIGRSMRLFHHNGMGATLQTFVMRLVIVGVVGCIFARSASATDPYAFCMSYCGTFFVYMCWLTWRTYKMPVQYQPKKAATKSTVQTVEPVPGEVR